MKPRVNCYKIGRIEYRTRPERFDWLCVEVWVGIVVAVAAFWCWVGVRVW